MRNIWPAIAALAALGTTASAGQSPPTPAAPRIPVEAFADTPFFTDPVLSPDGKRIVGRAIVDGKPQLFVYGIDDDYKQLIPIGDVTITNIAWAGNQRLLLAAATKTTIYEQSYPVTRLFKIDVANGRAVLLDKKSRGLSGADILYVARDGAWLLLASQDNVFTEPSVKRVDLLTGEVTTVERQRTGVWDWYADDAGAVRAGVAYAGTRWTIWYRAAPGAPLKPIRGRLAKDESGTVDLLRFVGGDASDGLIITNTKTGRFGAYHYDFANGAIGEPYFEHPDVDIARVFVDASTRAVTGVAYTDDRYRVAWIEPKAKALQASVDRVLKNAENIVMSVSDDGNRALLWSGSAMSPGSYYVYDRAARKMMSLVRPFAKLADAPLSDVTAVRYSARDGLSVPGYLTLPRGRPAKDLPLIVMPHGGPHARDAWDFDPWVQLLASRGYAVLQPNFRGSTGYGKAYVEKGYGQWGRAMQDDIDDGVDWLVKSGRVDAKRVCIMGASYGGYAALWGAIRNPDRYRCAISFAGVTDVPGMLRYDRKAFAAPRYFREWQKKVQGEGDVDLTAVSPLAQANRLAIPVLIGHGEKDDNVPAKQGHQMVKALQIAGRRDVESVFYAEEGHSLGKAENKLDFLKRLEAFLARHNPA